MTTVLAQLFVALGVSVVVGFALGFTFGVARPLDEADARTSPGDTAPAETNLDEIALDEIVQREASLIEQLARADDDLRAHALELADANEEITCLLEQLHEARHAD